MPVHIRRTKRTKHMFVEMQWWQPTLNVLTDPYTTLKTILPVWYVIIRYPGECDKNDKFCKKSAYIRKWLKCWMICVRKHPNKLGLRVEGAADKGERDFCNLWIRSCMSFCSLMWDVWLKCRFLMRQGTRPKVGSNLTHSSKNECVCVCVWEGKTYCC